MTLYIRDNGEHDSDTTAGVIRDPGYIGSVATATVQKAENTTVETTVPTAKAPIRERLTPILEGTTDSD